MKFRKLLGLVFVVGLTANSLVLPADAGSNKPRVTAWTTSPRNLALTPTGVFIDRSIPRDQGSISVLVHARPDRWADAVQEARALGMRLGSRFPMIGVFAATGDWDSFLDLASMGTVTYLEANESLAYFTDTSHKATRGEVVLSGAVKVRGKTIDGRGVGVAIVDTGVEGTHPDLADRMGGNVRFVCTDPGYVSGNGSECRGHKQAVEVVDSDTPALSGHGTHVAGIVAGSGESSNGAYHGAAPGATIYGVGIGTVVLVENALDGLRWVLDNHDRVTPRIRVVNNSWGSEYDPAKGGDPATGAVTKLVNLLVKEGVTVVFAAGNAGGTGGAPRTSVECVNPTPGVVCVANYDDLDKGSRKGGLDSTSSRGKHDEPATWPDVSAPGTSITSTCRATLPVCNVLGGQWNPTTYHATLGGTSMAAPHVAGIVAQLYQVDPKASPAEIEDILEDTAYKFSLGAPSSKDPFGGPYSKDPSNPDDSSSFDKGHGLVDALAAFKYLRRR